MFIIRPPEYLIVKYNYMQNVTLCPQEIQLVYLLLKHGETYSTVSH